MYKDFLKELFGIVFYGLTFERIFWTLVAVVGAYLLFRAFKAYQAKLEPLLTTRSVVGVAMVGFGAYSALGAWFSPTYKLFFSSPLVLHTYGVAIATGFITAIWFALREAKRTGLSQARVMDLAFWGLIAGLVGARLVFMMVEWHNYVDMCFDPAAAGLTQPDCLAALKFWKGGLVFYGGMLLAVGVSIFYLRKHNLPILRYADATAPSIAIGSMFGRLGCLSAGCCHGSYAPSNEFFALRWGPDTAAYNVISGTLPAGSPDATLFATQHFVTAHPTQLYESCSMILVFMFLLWLRSRKQFNGQLLLAYIMIYAVVRSTIEIFRGDTIRGHIFEYTNASATQFLGLQQGTPLFLSVSQFISLLAVAGCVVAWFYLRRRGVEQTQAVLKRASS